MKPLLPHLLALLLVAVGVLAVVGGELDDSPGLGGLGLIAVLGAVVLTVRTVRRRA